MENKIKKFDKLLGKGLIDYTGNDKDYLKYALTGQDIKTLTGFMPYPMTSFLDNNLNDLFDKNNNCLIVLYLYNIKPYYGHYLGLKRFIKDSTIEIFDPYAFKINKLDENLTKKAGNQDDLFIKKIKDAGYKIKCSNYPLQNRKNLDIATCGRWASIYCSYGLYHMDDFLRFMIELKKITGLNYDEIALQLTEDLI